MRAVAQTRVKGRGVVDVIGQGRAKYRNRAGVDESHHRATPRVLLAAQLQTGQAAMEIQAQASLIVLLRSAADDGGQMKDSVHWLGHQRGPSLRIRQVTLNAANIQSAPRGQVTIGQADPGQGQVGQGQAAQTLVHPGQEMALQQVSGYESASASDQDVHHLRCLRR